MALQEELKTQGDFLFKYRGYLPVTILIVGFAIKIYYEYTIGGKDETIIAQLMENSALIIGIIGLLVRVFTIGYTPIHTSGRNTTTGQVAATLNTTGLYSLIRNPLYLGNYLMWLGVTMLTKNIWFVLFFSLIFWIYYERIIYAEEYFLRKKFGEIYLNWSIKTPPFLPIHFKYKRPNISFSWKKVLRMEKTGLFSLFLLFFLFDIAGKYAGKKTFVFEENWYLIGTIVSGLIYIIIKILLKRTNFLDEADR